MSFNKKISAILLTFLTSSVLSGCIYNNEDYRDVEERAKEIAKEYVLQKYNEAYDFSDIYMRASPGHTFNEEPSGDVVFCDNEKGYSVFVELYSNEKRLSVGDDKYADTIKEDVKEKYIDKYLEGMEYTMLKYQVYEIDTIDTVKGEYFSKDIHYAGNLEEFLNNNNIGIYLEIFLKAEEVDKENVNSYLEELKRNLDNMLDNITSDFRGTQSIVSIDVYKPDKYMNEEVSAIIDKRPADSSLDRYIYSSDYVYLSYSADKSFTYELVNDEYKKVILPWEIKFSHGNNTEITKTIKEE